MSWGPLARIGNIEDAHKTLSRNLTGNDRLKDEGADGKLVRPHLKE